MGEMKKFVFIDESIRDQYTIAAVIVPITKVGEYRSVMYSLKPKGSSSFHMGNEKKPARKNALRVFSSLEYVEVILSQSKLKVQAAARQEALNLIVKSLEQGEFHMLLDQTTMEPSDRQTLFNFRATYNGNLDFVHTDRHIETGLWGADIVAWSVGTSYIAECKVPVKDARLGSQPPAAS
jgi:hypothetical protein